MVSGNGCSGSESGWGVWITSMLGRAGCGAGFGVSVANGDVSGFGGECLTAGCGDFVATFGAGFSSGGRGMGALDGVIGSGVGGRTAIGSGGRVRCGFAVTIGLGASATGSGAEIELGAAGAGVFAGAGSGVERTAT